MEKLELLRQSMKEQNMDAYLIVTDDFHGSEYVGEYFKTREFMSGFTGSAGSLVVLPKEAALFTDGRYFIQAQKQLQNSGIKLMKMGERGVPSIWEYLYENLKENAVIGFDGRTVSERFANQIMEKVKKKNISFCGDYDLVDKIWVNRPALSKKPVFSLPIEYTGKTRKEKLEELRKAMKEEEASYLLLTALDEIAWTLNLRGHDVAYTPVFLSFFLLEESKATLFVHKEILEDEISKELLLDGIMIKPYVSIYENLKNLSKEKKVWYDGATANYRIALSIQNKMDKQSPVILKKAVKNETEISHMKQAHIKDGIAVCRFMHWLKTTVKDKKVTELEAVNKIQKLREEMEGYLEPSFSSIVAYGEHGAIVHYEPTVDSDVALENRGLCLCDLGGQFMDGTTDVTRTFVMGPLTEEERHFFTLVLKGHIALAMAVFPQGICGANLDILARGPLWKEGLDYNHGTGHGVGCLLNVHEGPQRFHYRILPGVNQVVLEEGMITSDEPGFYAEGKFGIRHENLVLVKSAEKEGMLCFEPLTLVPFDVEGIDLSILTKEELLWLNSYHKKVYQTLKPYLTEEEGAWLLDYTREIVC